MIDISAEQMMTLSQATRELPGRPAVSTLWRWLQHGVRGVRLETIMVGGVRYTSRESLQRFAEAVTAASDGGPTPTRTSRQKQRDMDGAKLELARDGI